MQQSTQLTVTNCFQHRRCSTSVKLVYQLTFNNNKITFIVLQSPLKLLVYGSPSMERPEITSQSSRSEKRRLLLCQTHIARQPRLQVLFFGLLPFTPVRKILTPAVARRVACCRSLYRAKSSRLLRHSTRWIEQSTTQLTSTSP